jgi:hypothetical protein
VREWRVPHVVEESHCLHRDPKASRGYSCWLLARNIASAYAVEARQSLRNQIVHGFGISVGNGRVEGFSSQVHRAQSVLESSSNCRWVHG